MYWCQKKLLLSLYCCNILGMNKSLLKPKIFKLNLFSVWNILILTKLLAVLFYEGIYSMFVRVFSCKSVDRAMSKVLICLWNLFHKKCCFLTFWWVILIFNCQFVFRFIRAGSELTWDYGYQPGIVEGKVMYCYCGSSNCRGRLL